MSDAALAAQSKRIEELTAELSTVRSEAKTRRVANKKLAEEIATLKGSVANLTKERDEFKGKAESNPTELQAKLDAALGQIRDRTHRDAIQGLYDDSELDLSKSVPIDTLLKLIDYKAEGDAPDLKAIKAKVTAAQAANPFLKGQHGTGSQEAAGAAQNGKPRLDTGLGDAGSRGGHDTTARVMRVRRSEMQDPDFMRRNTKAIAEASAAGNFTIVDG